ncbi:PilC/PilY family type IV pilus protein [Acinetobacter faecalis]|uniref:PilC/PilY family type IV pilus protein n=1 Tax=Acinetobacter faecalis TaxID=2665161 RepID=UPI002A91307D|nr:PilC/PilY family type IV pilus protein [Acinetobacter faecalis]MDY6449382.1 PilC/PilY family type IV pilus protein [Acinetobacter faecalis]
MYKKMNQNKIKQTTKKLFVCALSTSLTGAFSAAITHASDIEIYKNPTVKSHTIVMLALDNSYSMDIKDAGKSKTRLEILKQSLKEVLEGVKDAKGNYITTPLPDDTIVGLSTFGTDPRHGKILVAARPLNQWAVEAAKYQRQALLDEINRISATASTPTSLLYGETVSYLRGTATTALVDVPYTNNGVESGVHTKFNSIADLTIKSPLLWGEYGGRYRSPMSQLSEREQQCTSQGIFVFTDGAPTTITPTIAEPIFQNALNDRSFRCDSTETPAVYYSLKNVDGYHRGAGKDNAEIKEMGYADTTLVQNKIATGNSNLRKDLYEDRSAWQCIGAMAKRIALESDPTKRIYTAVVGFGPDFSENLSQSCSDPNGVTYAGHTRYKYCGSPQITASSRGYSNGLNVQNAFSWGELGKGATSKLHYPDAVNTHPANITPERGGYFDASNGESQPIVDALSKFVNSMNVSFDAASFGTYVVPTDSLSSTSSSNVFAPQFQPKISGSGSNVQSTQQLWLGNLKKYRLNNLGVMVDARNIELLSLNGLVNTNSKDLWNISNDNDGASAILGGVASLINIPNGKTGSHKVVSNVSEINTRPLFTDAKIETLDRIVESLRLKKLTSHNALTKIDTALVLDLNEVDLFKVGFRRSIYQPYLLSALGYHMDKSYLDTEWNTTRWSWDLDKVKSLNTTRQMGGVLHSDPILVTSEAPVDENGNVVQELRDRFNNLKASRQDYIVFGTMQGLLHMVDQNTGREVFSFLPHEIINDPERKDALLDISNLQKATKHPFYGIDGPWVSSVDYEYIEEPDNTFEVLQNNINKKTYMRKFKAKTANIYGGMRMGGNSYYALDVKDPTTPKFLFHVDAANGKIKSATTGITSTSANPALQAMGQSWSKPTLAKVRFNGTLRDVMIVGGGYDYNVYENLQARSTSDKGAGVYMFDAKTGELLWNARYGTDNTSTTDVKNSTLKYSVVSQIKAFDRNADGLVDNLYFGDLGGQVFRVDLNNNLGTAKTSFGRVVRVADFSAKKQRFYEMPALSIHEDSGAKFGVISIASGNRSFPTSVSNGFDNRVYVLFDKDIASESLYAAGFAPSVTLTEADIYDWGAISASNIGDLRTKTKRGWYYILTSTRTGIDEPLNTGTVKALNGYTVVAYNDVYSDLYVSLFNPNHASTQQPSACVGGITGSSVITKFCLPYGVCGDSSLGSSVTNNKKVAFVSKPTDGFSRVNAGGYNDGSRNLVTIIPDVGQSYQMTKVFKSRNWREVQ